jgi:methyl-accepting chemotaxis protein
MMFVKKEEGAGAANVLVELADKLADSATKTRTAIEDSAKWAEKAGAISARFSTMAETIATIASTIEIIARQTKLLALNASIEAARTGESGLGFAVIANELKTLSDQTASASNKISKHIYEIRHCGSEIIDCVDMIIETTAEATSRSTSVVDMAREHTTIATIISERVNETLGAPALLTKKLPQTASASDRDKEPNSNSSTLT